MSQKEKDKEKEQSRTLPDGFAPGPEDVICSWARQNHRHSGNIRFRELVEEFAHVYLKAKTKCDKTNVIIDLIEKIRRDSPNGGFVKKDYYAGRWFEIGSDRARDKVGHAIRKAADKLLKDKAMGKGSTVKAAINRKKRARESTTEKAQVSTVTPSTSSSVVATLNSGLEDAIPSPVHVTTREELSPFSVTCGPNDPYIPVTIGSRSSVPARNEAIHPQALTSVPPFNSVSGSQGQWHASRSFEERIEPQIPNVQTYIAGNPVARVAQTYIYPSGTTVVYQTKAQPHAVYQAEQAGRPPATVLATPHGGAPERPVLVARGVLPQGYQNNSQHPETSTRYAISAGVPPSNVHEWRQHHDPHSS